MELKEMETIFQIILGALLAVGVVFWRKETNLFIIKPKWIRR
jgi:hypothetical protein